METALLKTVPQWTAGWERKGGTLQSRIGHEKICAHGLANAGSRSTAF